MVGEILEPLYVIDLLIILKELILTSQVQMISCLMELHMFNFLENVLKINYPKITVMRGFEHTVSLFFNDASKIPVVNQMITAHKAIYKLFDSGII